MTENPLFVENPLQISGLFGQGVFVIPESKNRKYTYFNSGEMGILNVFFYENSEIPASSFSALEKIMKAVNFNGKSAYPKGYAIINAATVNADDVLFEIMNDFNPVKTIVWTDKWISLQKEIVYYNCGNGQLQDVLRCHSIETVVSDDDRKRECWSAIKQLFGM